MKKETYLKTITEYRKELDRQDAKNSTGSNGKLAEVIIRNEITVKGIQTVEDVKCRFISKTDARTKQFGKVEIKTGSGAVAYSDNAPFTKNDLTEENVLKGCDTVVWIPFPAVINWTLKSESDYERLKREIKNTALIFTRNEFIECLKTIGKNGLKSSLKTSKQGIQINIQTISPKMESKLFDFIEENEIMTIKELEDK